CGPTFLGLPLCASVSVKIGAEFFYTLKFPRRKFAAILKRFGHNLLYPVCLSIGKKGVQRCAVSLQCFSQRSWLFPARANSRLPRRASSPKWASPNSLRTRR